MKNIFLIFLLAFIGCSSNDDDRSNGVNFSLIAQGNLYGNGEEDIEKVNLIIEDSTSWNELVNKMNVLDNFQEIDIDFSQSHLIVVFDQIYVNGGHSIDIIDIKESEDSLTIIVDRLMNGDLTLIVTQPYHIVKIPKTEKQIIFKNIY